MKSACRAADNGFYDCLKQDSYKPTKIVIFLVVRYLYYSKKFMDFRERRKEESMFVLHIFSWQVFFGLEVTLKLSKTAEICCSVRIAYRFTSDNCTFKVLKPFYK